jgi:hypothetical protein
MTKDKLLPNRSLCSLIEDAEVRCFSYDFVEENKVKGKKRKLKDTVESCEWTGKLKDAEAHYNRCQFAQTNCPHDGCDDVFVRKDLQEHIEDCIHRPVVCEWCEIVKSADAIDLHLRWCSNRPVPCPNNCLGVNREVSRFLPSAMDQHRSICGMELVDCAFAASGCKTKLQRKDMPLHEQDVGAHMVCFFGALQTAQQRINGLEAKIVDLEQVVTEQEEVIKRLDNADCSQIVLWVPISDLHKKNVSSTVTIRGYDFKIRLEPSSKYPGWQALFVFLLGDSQVDLSRNVKVDYVAVCNPGPSESKTLVHKFIKPEGYGWLQFYKTTALQNPPYVEDGHILIKVNITLQ